MIWLNLWIKEIYGLVVYLVESMEYGNLGLVLYLVKSME